MRSVALYLMLVAWSCKLTLSLRFVSTRLIHFAARRPMALHAAGGGPKKKTGAFKAMSETFPGPTHYKRALRALKVVKPDINIKNVRNKERKLTAVSMDALMKALTVPISELLTLYTSTLKTLHPFEATVADLTVTAREKKGHQSLATILANLKGLRATTSRVAKDYASRGANAESAAVAKLLLEEGTKKLEELFEHR